MSLPRVPLALGLWAALALPAAQAVVTPYDAEAAFQAASPVLGSYDFNGIVLLQPQNFALGPQTLGGVTFNSTGSGFTLAASGSSWQYGVQFYSGQSPNAAPSDVVVSLAGAYAIGFEYGAYATTAGSPVTFTLSTGDVFVRNLPANPGIGTNFIGFVSTTPITGLTMATIPNIPNPPPYAYSLDVLRFSVSSLVPEPAVAWMLLPGLLVLAAARRRFER